MIDFIVISLILVALLGLWLHDRPTQIKNRRSRLQKLLDVHMQQLAGRFDGLIEAAQKASHAMNAFANSCKSIKFK